MNKIVLFLLASVVSISSFANPAKTATIKGKVTNPTVDSVFITYVTNWVNYSRKTVSGKLDKEGNFSLSFPVEEAYLPIDVYHGDQMSQLFVEPGYDLTLSVDASDFDKTLKYDGKGKELANFIADHIRDKGLSYEVHSNIQPLYKREVNEFPAALDSILATEYDYLKEHGKDIPEGFKKYWNTNIKYIGYYSMFSYPRSHAKAKKLGDEIPAEFYAVSDRVPKEFDDALLPISMYRTYAGRYYELMARSAAAKNKEAEGKNVIVPELLAKQNMPPKTLEHYMADKCYETIKYSSLDSAEKKYAGFKKEFPKSQYAALVDRHINLKRSMQVGQPAIDIDFKTAEGKKVKLSDLKGNVVLVDFWATDCPYCILEMPSSKKVHEYFKDKKVVFLYISLDENDTKWKGTIDKYDVQGMHTRLDGDFQAPAAQAYGISGVPTYYLIDKQGKFAIEEVPRPSETETLIKTIENLL